MVIGICIDSSLGLYKYCCYKHLCCIIWCLLCISVEYKSRDEIAKSWVVYIYLAYRDNGKQLAKVIHLIYIPTRNASPKLSVIFYILICLENVYKYPIMVLLDTSLITYEIKHLIYWSTIWISSFMKYLFKSLPLILLDFFFWGFFVQKGTNKEKSNWW